MNQKAESVKFNLKDWLAKAKELYGNDPINWKFKCANCGHVQSGNDFIQAKVTDWDSAFYFSCIGRWTGGEGTLGNKKSPCNYTLGGLFCLAKVYVIDEDGKEYPVFEFADPVDTKEGVVS